MTAAALLREAASTLRGAGVEAADWDAERLLRHVLGWERGTLLARPAAELDAASQARFRGLVARRAARVPLQHLLGSQAFWRHEFLVTPDVLIPRPESELLVEAALERLRGCVAPLIVDVGTGSGCIALSLAAALPRARVHATEVSHPALEVARENARRLGLTQRVVFHEGDLLDPVSSLKGSVDLVVSNPPYVDEGAREALAPEVRDHEPAVALFAAEHGLGTYRRLLPEACAVLRGGGTLVVELGFGQQDAVAQLCAAAGLAVAEVRADLQSIPRALVAAKPAG
jgi:release factor glutamine methyltransferase